MDDELAEDSLVEDWVEDEDSDEDSDSELEEEEDSEDEEGVDVGEVV